ncbi:unnamed protein product [Urochloa decumbens]|uniref:F-box domain-containing protein n=1 Tax=Urochloa decumbens TaxID=240449 RepID=A0ABC8YL71_9POAL
MESSNNDVVHEAKRAKLSPPVTAADDHGTAAGGGEDDLISGLPDDLLLRILGLLPDASDAVRTGALSRRWRGLWARAPALRFTPWPLDRINSSPSYGPDCTNTERFIAFASNALALRAQQSRGAAMEHLQISLAQDLVISDQDQDQLPRLHSISIRAAESWVRYAAQQPVRSFSFDHRLPIPRRVLPGDDEEGKGEDEEGPNNVMALDDLPSSAKLETLRLELDHGCRMAVAAGSGHHFARLLSSACCPCLKKLRMWCVWLPAGMNELLVESTSLLELTMDDMYDMSLIELRTPSLRVLEVKECVDLEVLVVSAPMLEELMFLRNSYQVLIDGDLSSVGSLKIDLVAYKPTDDHQSSVSLLQCCTSARCLDVSLQLTAKNDVHNFDIIKGRIPHLDHVTSLNVHISPLKRHCFGDYVARLLSLFRNLAYLCLDFDTYIEPDDLCLGSDFICDHLDHWKYHKISSVHLQKAEFRGLTGTDCELRFLRSVLASARQLQVVVVSFNPHFSVEEKRDDFQNTLLGSGTWSDCHDTSRSYEWRPSQ